MPMIIWLSVVRPMTLSLSGASMAMRGSLAAALTRASSEQLMQPDAVLVGGPARVGGDAPARLDLAFVHEREDEVGVPDIDREQHGGALGEEPPSAKRQAVATTGWAMGGEATVSRSRAR